MKLHIVFALFCLVLMFGTGFSDYAQGATPVPCDDVTPGKEKFECGDGTCLVIYSRNSKKCDSRIDCANAQDEDPTICRTLHHRNCRDMRRINSNYFQCDDGMCIPNANVNDGKWHCSDKSDEDQE